MDPWRECFEHRQAGRASGVVADKEVPVRVWIQKNFAARSNAVDPLARLGTAGPLGARAMYAVGNHVELQRPGPRIKAANGIAPAERSFTSAEDQHHVLAGLKGEIVKPAAG